MIQVQCLFCPAPRQVIQVTLSLPPGCLVKDALLQLHNTTAWLGQQPTDQNASNIPPKQGIWGRMVTLNQVLKDGDRLEIYRPLLVDPKLARKQRFKRQGKGRTGLFARRRVGAVAGY